MTSILSAFDNLLRSKLAHASAWLIFNTIGFKRLSSQQKKTLKHTFLGQKVMKRRKKSQGPSLPLHVKQGLQRGLAHHLLERPRSSPLSRTGFPIPGFGIRGEQAKIFQHLQVHTEDNSWDNTQGQVKRPRDDGQKH